MKLAIVIVLLGLICGSFAATQTILEIIQTPANNLTSLSTSLASAPGLGNLLNATTPSRTLIGPNNAGMALLTSLNSTGIYPDLNTTLYYHTVTTFPLPTVLPLDSNYTTLVNGKIVRFNNYTGSGMGFNNVTLVNGQPYNPVLAATNGEVRVISSVLYPPLGTALEALQRLPEFSNAYALILRASQSTRDLINSNQVTAFVPNNTALAAFNTSYLIPRGVNLNNISAAQADQLLANHVLAVSAAVFSRALPTSLLNVATKLGGTNHLNITISSGVVTVTAGAGSGPVVNPDLVINGGVAHGINGVLAPAGFIPTPTPSTTTGATTGGTTGTSTTNSAAVAVFSIFLLVATIFAAIF